MKFGNLLAMFLALLFLFSLGPVYGDVLEPGKKTVPIYYVLENIDDYPGYVFLLHGNPSPDFQILNSSSFTFYKFSVASIYAVNQSDFNPEVLKSMDSSQLDAYFQNDSRVLNSNLKLEAIYDTVSDTNPLENATIMLKVVSLDENSLKINKDRVVFGYNDGQTEEKSFMDQNNTPSAPTTEGNLYWYYLVPILAVVAILLVLLHRRYRG